MFVEVHMWSHRSVLLYGKMPMFAAESQKDLCKGSIYFQSNNLETHVHKPAQLCTHTHEIREQYTRLAAAAGHWNECEAETTTWSNSIISRLKDCQRTLAAAAAQHVDS